MFYGWKTVKLNLPPPQRKENFRFFCSIASSWYHQPFPEIDPDTIMSRSFLRVFPLLVLLFAVIDNHTKTQLVIAE